MKRAREIVIVAIALSWARLVDAAGSTEGGTIPWVPYALSGIVANAAIDENALPVVLYNSDEQKALFPSVGRFFMLREEVVATHAVALLDSKQLTLAQVRKAGGRRADVGRYLLIEESLVYQSVQNSMRDLKGLDAEAMVSCAAYASLSTEQRLVFMREYRMADGFGDRAVFGDSRRTVTYRELRGQLQTCDGYLKTRTSR